MRQKLAMAALFLLAGSARLAIAAQCTVAAFGVNFGDFSGTTIQTDGVILLNCPSGYAYQIGLDQGTGIGATLTNRSMTGPGNAQLGYELYSDSAYTQNWGDSSSSGWVTGTGTGNYQILHVYGQLPSNEYAPPGSYSDSTVNVYVSGPNLTTASTHFSVQATVEKACSITATALNFGNYSGALLDSTATLSVQCTSTTTYTVGLDAGTASGATVTSRMMTGPNSALMDYSLFSNSGYSVNWGNSSGSWVSGTGTGLVQNLTVYGQISAKQSLPPGTYTDTVIATVSY